MEYSFEIAKARIYINSNKKTLAAIKSETGCDVVINGGIYNMSTFKPLCHLKADGKVHAADQYKYWGFGWNGEDTKLQMVNDYAKLDNYICCSALLKDGKAETLIRNDAMWGVRGRTAIGTLADGKVVIFCSKDGTVDAMTPEALQKHCLQRDWKNALMLDGGGSSQCITPEGKITSTRIVQNVLCFWLKKETTKTDTTEGEVEGTMVPIKNTPAHSANHGSARSVNDIEYIVIHYTANDGDTDENNGKYFKNNAVKSSAQYFVDSDSVTRSVPDDVVAYSVGGVRYANYKETGGAKFYGKCTNSNSISIELCDDVKNGKVYPSAKTIENAVALTKMLMKKYDIPADRVIRHFDVTGKICPGYWAGTAEKDKLWLSEFWNKLGGTTKVTQPTTATNVTVEPARSLSNSYSKTYTVTADSLNMRRGAGTGKAIIKALKKGERFRCYGYYTTNGGTTWLLGVDEDGVSGYCSKKYLK